MLVSSSRDHDEALRLEITGWPRRHAPGRPRSLGGQEELLHLVRLLGLPEADRWPDPHWRW